MYDGVAHRRGTVAHGRDHGACAAGRAADRRRAADRCSAGARISWRCSRSARWPRSWCGCCCRRRCGERAPEPVSIVSILRSYRGSSGNATSSSISASPPAAWRACSPGFRPRRSCCRTSTACRRWRSASHLRSAASGYLIGTIDRGPLRGRLGRRSHHGSRRRRDGRRRHRAGAGCRRRMACRGRPDPCDRTLSRRHGPGVAAGAGRRAAAISGPRRRRVVAARLHHPDHIGGGRRRAWPCAWRQRLAVGHRGGAGRRHRRGLWASTHTARERGAGRSAPSEQPVEQPIVDAAGRHRPHRRFRIGTATGGASGAGGAIPPNGGAKPANGPADQPGNVATGTP